MTKKKKKAKKAPAKKAEAAKPEGWSAPLVYDKGESPSSWSVTMEPAVTLSTCRSADALDAAADGLRAGAGAFEAAAELLRDHNRRVAEARAGRAEEIG